MMGVHSAVVLQQSIHSAVYPSWVALIVLLGRILRAAPQQRPDSKLTVADCFTGRFAKDLITCYIGVADIDVNRPAEQNTSKSSRQCTNMCEVTADQSRLGFLVLQALKSDSTHLPGTKVKGNAAKSAFLDCSWPIIPVQAHWSQDCPHERSAFPAAAIESAHNHVEFSIGHALACPCAVLQSLSTIICGVIIL